MKELLVIALDNAYQKIQKQIPLTKKTTKSIDILGVKPLDIPLFIKKNNIPDDAFFDMGDNGYDGGSGVYLSWYIVIPTTDKEKLLYIKKRFNDIAWGFVYNLLLDNGYKRDGYSTALLEQFKNKTVYDMYMDKDFDNLVKYYSLPFNKVS